MREFLNHAVLSMSDSTMAVSSKNTQDLSVQIVFFTFSCKWCLCFYFWAVIWSYIVDLFAGLHELASASSRTLLKLASSLRALLKPYGDTLRLLINSCTLISIAAFRDCKTICPFNCFAFHTYAGKPLFKEGTIFSCVRTKLRLKQILPIFVCS